MLHDHLEFHHQDADTKVTLSPGDIDEDSVQPLLFDFVRMDEVRAVKKLLPFGRETLPLPVCLALDQVAASTASAKMMDLLANEPRSSFHRNKVRISKAQWHCVEISPFIHSIEGKNLETFSWFRLRIDAYWSRKSSTSNDIDQCLGVFKALSDTDSTSQIMFRECESLLVESVSYWCRDQTENIVKSYKFRALATMIEDTNGEPDLETRLQRVWNAVRLREPSSFLHEVKCCNFLLGKVACTTFSIRMAKVLLKYGAAISGRNSVQSPTALHSAVRQNSSKAATFIIFLLYRGADPEIGSASSNARKISEEKGAKGIAKWIGISWDELVEQVRQDRERGYCPPEYQ